MTNALHKQKHQDIPVYRMRRVPSRWAGFVWSLVILLCGGGDAWGGDLKDIVTDLYGGDGIRLGSPMAGFSHAPHFTAGSLNGLEDLSSALSGTLGFSSFNSVVTGFTLDLETGEPVRTTDSLGPLLAETATTLGEHKLNVGFSFTRSRFKRLEGDGTDNLVLLFNHPDANGDGVLGPAPGAFDFELDQVRVDLNLDITQELYVLFATYGVTDRLDVGIVLPIVYLSIKADGVATIVDNSPSSNVHFFAPGGSDPLADDPRSSISRSKLGIGDIVLRTKYNLVRGDENLSDMAVGGILTLPTGDQDNLLGTGETRIQALWVVSKAFDKLTPHLNLGYEWAPGDHQLNSLRYVIGIDAAPDPRLAVSFDLIGRWEHSGDGVGDHIIDAAIGAKWNVHGDTLLNFYILVPINRDEGLRADFVWSVGVERTF